MIRQCIFVQFNKCRISHIRKYTNKNLLALRERGVIQSVFPDKVADEAIEKAFESKPQHIYAGFDPTADSLHVGNLLIIMGLLHCQRAGHHPIALIGGATGQVGDPSGRQTERKYLVDDVLQHNLKCIRDQITRMFANHDEYFWTTRNQEGRLRPVKVVNNADWYKSVDLIDFLKNACQYLRMGELLTRSSVKSRLETGGMNFTEFSYQALQAYDWLHLYKEYECRFQIGGNDQLGNMYSGHDLITRSTKNNDAYALTLPIITNEEGSKFGKSAGNALWLDANKTSPFTIYQFFVRIADTEVEKLLKILTFLELDEIADIMNNHRKNPESLNAQKKLASEITLLIHGKTGLQKAIQTTEALYVGNLDVLGKLTATEIKEVFSGATICDILLEPGMTALDLAMKAKCFDKERNAVRIMLAGGFSINQSRCQNIAEVIVPTVHILPNNHTLLRVGKRNYYIINWLK